MPRQDYLRMIAAFFSGAMPAFGGAMAEKWRFKREQEASQKAEESRRVFEEGLLGKRLTAEENLARIGREFQASEAAKGREFTAGQAEQKFVREQDVRTQQAVQAFQERKEQSEQMNRLTEGYIYATHPQAVVTKPTGELDYEATVRNLTPDAYKDLLYIQARGVPSEPVRKEDPEDELLLRSVGLFVELGRDPNLSPEERANYMALAQQAGIKFAKKYGLPLPTTTGGTTDEGKVGWMTEQKIKAAPALAEMYGGLGASRQQLIDSFLRMFQK